MARTKGCERDLPLRHHLVLARNAAQEWPEPVAQLRRDEGPSFLGAKDTVVVGADVGPGRPLSRPFETLATTNARPQR